MNIPIKLSAITRFQIHIMAAATLLFFAIWFSSGTLAPYAATLTDPMILKPSGYLVNNDNDHYRAPFLMLDGANRSEWAFSVVLRRILFPLFSYPWMKCFGFLEGGALASLFIHLTSFLIFFQYAKKTIGESGAIFGMWLFATYPGIVYWSGLPYCNATIVPCSLMSVILIEKLEQTKSKWRIFGFSLSLGILFLAYDLLPFFGFAALWIFYSRRDFKNMPLILLGIAAPQLISNSMLSLIYDIRFVNSNTMTYLNIWRSFFRIPDFGKWLSFALDTPKTGMAYFFFGNFFFIPLFFLVVFIFNQSLTQKLRFSNFEKGMILASTLIFLLTNLAPPYEGWQFRGEWIARLYQPMFVVFLLFLMKFFQNQTTNNPKVRKNMLAGALMTFLLNSIVVFGPISGCPLLASELYQRFYSHSNTTALPNNLKRYGRFPIGFNPLQKGT